MITPPYLKLGDTIGITCPASKMDREVALYAGQVLESWGFKTILGKTVGNHYYNFSATDDERLKELQDMLNQEDIKAILFGRGGYGMLRIMDQLDFSSFKKQPKWICGYSDITALHIHIYKKFKIATLHSLMCSGITAETRDDDYVKSLKNALLGKNYNYSFSAHVLNRHGKCQGALIGGNLALLASLSGSASQPDTKGVILFIEDVGEYRYSIDRMMLNLKRAGWLEHLSGLLIGSFNECKENDEPFGQTEEEIILDKVKEYDYPVAFGFPVGHQEENYALKVGLQHELIVGEMCNLSTHD